MSRQRKWLCFFVFLAIYYVLSPKEAVFAKEQRIPFAEGNYEITITTGDTGRFDIPGMVTIDEIQRKVYSVNIEIMDYDSGYGWYDDYNTDEEEYSSEVLKVDKEGNFLAVAHGKAEVTITLNIEENENGGIYDEYYSSYSDTLEAVYTVTVAPNMTNVMLANVSIMTVVPLCGKPILNMDKILEIGATHQLQQI